MPSRFLSTFNLVRSRRSSYSSASTDREHSHPSSHVDSRRTSTTVFEADEHDCSDSMEHLRNIPGLIKHHSERKSSASGRSSPNPEASRAAKFDIIVESPPLVSYNTPANSSGALFSAQLKLDVVARDLTFDSVDLQLMSTISLKRPVATNCPDCSTQSTELKKWSFAEEPLLLAKGEHRFPFSYLFPGDLPATTHANLVKIDYHLAAVAKTSTGERITLDRSINLARSILPGIDKHSLRIFPPTNLAASVTLNPVIHPIGDFPVQFRLKGTTTRQDGSHLRWRIRKMNWRIEEYQKVLSPACPKHLNKVFDDSKGIMQEETHVVGESNIDYNRTPWKVDYDTGEVELEFQAALNPLLKPVCDVQGPNGLSITHKLVIEMVVAEEWALDKKPRNATPTGAARILRMSFHLLLTERAGLGISWDEETPPVYEDVPPSPPAYDNNTVEDFDLTELEGQIEDFRLGDSLSPPGSRQGSVSSPRAPLSPGRVQSSRLSVTAGPSSSSQVRSQSESRPRPRITVDDLLSEPNTPRRRSVEEDREDSDDGTAT